MSNYQVELIDKPAALTSEAIKSLRKQQVQGLSRRQLMRLALGTGVGLWLLEVTAGTLAFAWPNLKGGFGAPVKIGDLRHDQDSRTRSCRSRRASRPTTPRRVRS